MLYESINLEVGSLKQMVVKHHNNSINIAYFPGVHIILSNPYMFLVLLKTLWSKGFCLNAWNYFPAYTNTVKTFKQAANEVDWVNIQRVQCWNKQRSNWKILKYLFV